MTDTTTQDRLIVPIANPETVDRLLDTAIDIARDRSLSIVATHIVEVPAQVPLSEGHRVADDDTDRLLKYVAERADVTDLTIESRTRYARDTAAGIVGSVDTYDGSAMLIGWRGRPRRRDIILGSFLDHVLRKAPCDVYVKRISQPSTGIDSILVPVAGGPHDELSASLAGTLARQHEATVLLYHVTSPATENTDGEKLIEERRTEIGSEVSINHQIVESDSAADTITEEAATHDMTILGATRDPFLKRRLVGSVAQSVGRSADSSVIVTRRYVSDTDSKEAN